MLHDRAKCPGCGTIAEEWVTVDGRPVIPPPFEPEVHVCIGCADHERFETSAFGDRHQHREPGQTIVLRRTDRSEYPRERWVGPSALDAAEEEAAR